MIQDVTIDRSQVALSDVQIVIGLEVHVQLKTVSKLFCGCSTTFGASPNTQTCPVCTGMPGTLPVLNDQAIHLAIQTGLALNCEIARYTKWDRKNYFYPDLPKGYQTSQFDQPICRGGYLDVADPKNTFEPVRVRLERAHLEEDAGKSMHDESQHGGASKIDLNRAGTPLLEIVTKPDLRTAVQAKAFLQELRLMLLYLDVSDGNMQEGSLRCDANVNLHIPVRKEPSTHTAHPVKADSLANHHSLPSPSGGKGPGVRGSGEGSHSSANFPTSSSSSTIATPIVEIKNLNSFRSVERAIQAEAKRQFDAWQASGLTISDVPKQTRGWNDAAQETYLQREKEDSADYRYFPCPDLIAFRVTDAEINAVESNSRQLPCALRKKLIEDYGLKPYDAEVIISQGRGLVNYFFELVRQLEKILKNPEAGANSTNTSLTKLPFNDNSTPADLSIRHELGKLSANWVGQEVLRYLNETNTTIEKFPLLADALAELLQMLRQGKLDQSKAKEVFNEMLGSSLSLSEAIGRLGIVSVDTVEIERIAAQLIAENPSVIEQIRAGNAKAIGALIGQAKKLNPNANPGLVKDAILRML